MHKNRRKSAFYKNKDDKNNVNNQIIPSFKNYDDPLDSKEEEKNDLSKKSKKLN